MRGHNSDNTGKYENDVSRNREYQERNLQIYISELKIAISKMNNWLVIDLKVNYKYFNTHDGNLRGREKEKRRFEQHLKK